MPKSRDPSNDVSAYLDYLIGERGCAKNTRITYARALAGFVAFAAEGRVRDYLVPKDDEIARYLAALMGQGLSPSTHALRITVLKSFYGWLVETERATADAARPVDLLMLPHRWTRRQRVLSVEQIDALLSAPERSDWLYARDKAILETLYATACRSNELCDLEVSDLDLRRASVRCRGKGNKERVLFLGRAAMAALGEYLVTLRPWILRHQPESAPAPWLFVSRSGRRLTRAMIFNVVSEYASRAGLDGAVGPHTLRRSCGTHLLRGGADIRAVAEFLGHSSVNTTQRYLILDDIDLKSTYFRCHPLGRPEGQPSGSEGDVPLDASLKIPGDLRDEMRSLAGVVDWAVVLAEAIRQRIARQ